jgi:hypothetical protein
LTRKTGEAVTGSHGACTVGRGQFLRDGAPVSQAAEMASPPGPHASSAAVSNSGETNPGRPARCTRSRGAETIIIRGYPPPSGQGCPLRPSTSEPRRWFSGRVPRSLNGCRNCMQDNGFGRMGLCRGSPCLAESCGVHSMTLGHDPFNNQTSFRCASRVCCNALLGSEQGLTVLDVSAIADIARPTRRSPTFEWRRSRR